ncbi:hypothetical protein ACFL1K_01695 [Candidatus Omnitrophota bacterium]
MNLPSHLSSLILFGWGMYFFIKKVSFKNLKATWTGLVKGIVLFILAIGFERFLKILEKNSFDIQKVDSFLSIPLVIITFLVGMKIVKNRKTTN